MKLSFFSAFFLKKTVKMLATYIFCVYNIIVAECAYTQHGDENDYIGGDTQWVFH